MPNKKDHLIKQQSCNNPATLNVAKVIFKIEVLMKKSVRWCPRTDSNRGPIDYKSIALPAELQGLAQ